MFKPSRFSSLLATFALLALAQPATTGAAGGATAADPDADYDRLDGTGASGKKVNVIEWEGNLEIHVYPAGSLKGLALKLDKRDKNKSVMVIGYRFDSAPQKQLVRRAILGIDLHEGFKAYKDPETSEYDKVVITNNGLGAPLALFKLDAEPKQLYPEGHPALAAQEKPEERKPANQPESVRKVEQEKPAFDQDSGTIRPFFYKESIGR